LLHLAAQSFNQGLGAGQLKRNHVYDNVGTKSGDSGTECASILFGRAVGDHILDGIPCSMVLVSFRLPTTNIDDIVTSLYKGGQ
jgi:hypothetical protein